MNIQIGHTEDGQQVALITEGRVYKWPTATLPTIIAALRAAAEGHNLPGARGMVFLAGDKVSISDNAASAQYTNIGGEAALVIDQRHWSYVMPKHEARRMADGFEQVLHELAPDRTSGGKR